LKGVGFAAKETRKLLQPMCDMNSLQRSENYGTTIFNRKQCQIIISNYGLFFIFLAKLAILNSLDIGVILTGYLLNLQSKIPKREKRVKLL
jgi:hypothetical protein